LLLKNNYLSVLLRGTRRHIFLLAVVFISMTFRAQVGPPSLRCAAVNAAGNVTITWVIPPDPSNQFTSYEIWSSALSAGPFSTVAIVSTYTQNTYLHAITTGTLQSQYYFIRTISNGGTVTSASSDTIRSIFLNIGSAANGRPPLSWNKIHTPLLPTGSPTFTLSRESPPGTWTTLYTGTNMSYIDTITICSVYYNYKVETSDAMGCISQSNINGGLYHDLTPPIFPTLDSVSVNPDGSVSIGWEPSKSADATRYVVYLASGVNSPLDTINGKFNTSYTYTNSSSSSGGETFIIAAMDSCGNISQLSNLGQTTIYLRLGYNFCARTANLSWTNYVNLPGGISKYKVYCSINGAPATVIGTTSANGFSHPALNPGDTYCYYVKVVNTGDVITANSNVKCLMATAPQGPAYVYIRSASVNPDKQVALTYIIDNSRAYKGATIFRSLDGISYSQLYYQASGSGTIQTYVDKDVKTSEHPYYYKIQISDSCGNPGPFSNSVKTAVLKVANDNANIYYNTLSWEDYSGFSGGVESYRIYRSVNGIFSPVPVDNVPYGTRVYVDNVEEFTSDQGKFSYYIEAVEGPGNTYGYKDSARSNIADAYAEVTVFVPNSFCPKGVNKIWMPVAQYVEKTDYKVTVFDRWGSKVFGTGSDTEGWDGSGVTDDVFVYLVEYKNARGEFIQLKGYVTMIR
jgi:hypothetical protein